MCLIKQCVCEFEIVFEHMTVWIMRPGPTECPRVKLDVLRQLDAWNRVFANLKQDKSIKNRKSNKLTFSTVRRGTKCDRAWLTTIHFDREMIQLMNRKLFRVLNQSLCEVLASHDL